MRSCVALCALQDGQEFSKLLLTLLETKLANSANPVNIFSRPYMSRCCCA